jgi:hypothetical protein
MIDKNHLTTREKFMNTVKVGTVSKARNINGISGMRLIIYTLCEVSASKKSPLLPFGPAR